jgi:hypothetical protein
MAVRLLSSFLLATNLTFSPLSTFLFTSLLFGTLLLATLYHHRRSHDSSIWSNPFNSFDWSKYSPRLGGGGGNFSTMNGEIGYRKSGSVQLA